MMGVEERVEVLKQHNPFLSSSAGDPWKEEIPDVNSVNEQVFNDLCELIHQKALNLSLNFTALILGKAGSGKTHLIQKLLKCRKSVTNPYLFSYVYPVEDAKQSFRHLLRELMTNLSFSYKKFSRVTQLDNLVAEMYLEAISEDLFHRNLEENYQHLQELQREMEPIDIFHSHIKIPDSHLEKIQEKAILIIRRDQPEISSSFLKVFLQYLIPQNRSHVVAWLQGEVLGKKELDMLGVPDRIRTSPEEGEQEAKSILISLGFLLKRYHQPLVTCFDSLESLETEEQVLSFGKLILFLVDKAEAILPFAFVEDQYWAEKFSKLLHERTITRLKTNLYKLGPCDMEEAASILEKRLSLALEDHADGISPFTQEGLAQAFEEHAPTAREVIMWANHRLKDLAIDHL